MTIFQQILDQMMEDRLNVIKERINIEYLTYWDVFNIKVKEVITHEKLL